MSVWNRLQVRHRKVTRIPSSSTSYPPTKRELLSDLKRPTPRVRSSLSKAQNFAPDVSMSLLLFGGHPIDTRRNLVPNVKGIEIAGSQCIYINAISMTGKKSNNYKRTCFNPHCPLPSRQLQYVRLQHQQNGQAMARYRTLAAHTYETVQRNYSGVHGLSFQRRFGSLELDNFGSQRRCSRLHGGRQIRMGEQLHNR